MPSDPERERRKRREEAEQGARRSPEAWAKYQRAVEVEGQIIEVLATHRGGKSRPRAAPLPTGREQGTRAAVRVRLVYWGRAIVAGVPLLNKAAVVALALLGGSILAACSVFAGLPLPWAPLIAVSGLLTIYLEGSYRVYLKAENDRRALETGEVDLFELANRCERLAQDTYDFLDERERGGRRKSKPSTSEGGYRVGAYQARTVELYGEVVGGDLLFLCRDLVSKDYLRPDEGHTMSWPQSIDQIGEVARKLERLTERIRVKLRREYKARQERGES